MAVQRDDPRPNRTPRGLHFEQMTLDDLPSVLHIERDSFLTPWSERAFVSELTQNVYAHYVVARVPAGSLDDAALAADDSPVAREVSRRRSRVAGWMGRGTHCDPVPSSKVVGYAGMWVVLDEAHVTNVAVAPEARGRDVGDALLTELENRAKARECLKMTLEVRPTNDVALALYRKHGFVARGRRPGYYSDTNEDAIIMWKDRL